MRKYSKSFIITICFALLFSFSFGKQSNASPNEHEKYKIVVNNDEELTIMGEMEDVKGFLTLNKESNEISLRTTGESDEFGNEDVDYQLEIETATPSQIEATFTDEDSDQDYYINDNEIQASVAFLIPVGIAIGEALLAHLIAIGLAAVISGVTYIAYEEFVKRDRSKSHYMAKLIDGKLFMGNGLSASAASKRLKAGGDTWSKSSMGAKNIAKDASFYKKTIGSEIDKKGKGKYYHYHPIASYDKGVAKRGRHAFYGGPRK